MLFLLLILLVLLISCTNEKEVKPISEKNNAEKAIQEREVLELFNTGDYVDPDNQSINFL